MDPVGLGLGQALFGELGRQDSPGMLTRLRSDLADTLILLRGACSRRAEGARLRPFSRRNLSFRR